MPGAPRFVFSFFAIPLLVISPPIRSQTTPQLAHLQEASPSAYPDSADGLKQFLASMLAAAKSADQARLSALIKDMEIPNYETWFIRTLGKKKGKTWIEPYGANLASHEKDFQELLLQFAQQEGEFYTRKVNGAPRDSYGLERALLDDFRQRVDIYFASWNESVGPGNSRADAIGYFLFIEGKFRWEDAFNFDSLQPGEIPGNAGPPSDASKQAANPPTPASGSGADEVTYEAGKNGVGQPSCLHCPPPNFSNAALKNKLEGTVVLRVVVDTNGRATDIQIVKRVGLGLDEQAVEAVRKWSFKPALDKNGRPVRVMAVIEVTFRLLH